MAQVHSASDALGDSSHTLYCHVSPTGAFRSSGQKVIALWGPRRAATGMMSDTGGKYFAVRSLGRRAEAPPERLGAYVACGKAGANGDTFDPIVRMAKMQESASLMIEPFAHRAEDFG